MEDKKPVPVKDQKGISNKPSHRSISDTLDKLWDGKEGTKRQVSQEQLFTQYIMMQLDTTKVSMEIKKELLLSISVPRIFGINPSKIEDLLLNSNSLFSIHIFEIHKFLYKMIKFSR